MSHIVDSGYIQQENGSHLFLEGSQEEELIIEEAVFESHEGGSVNVGTGTKGTKELKTKWPITEGLTLGTTRLSKKPLLRPIQKSLVRGWGSI